MNRVLIVVNVQNDFFPEGSLEVPDSERIVPVINDLILQFELIVYIRDWHPENYNNFTAEPQFTGKSWPAHCIANTHGADFHPELAFNLNAVIIDKGIDANMEGYSGFLGTKLADNLHKLGVNSLFITGLTTDYSVKATALDARKEGFTVYLVQDAVQGFDNPPGSVANAVTEMKQAGVKLVTAAEVGQYA